MNARASARGKRWQGSVFRIDRAARPVYPPVAALFPCETSELTVLGPCLSPSPPSQLASTKPTSHKNAHHRFAQKSHDKRTDHRLTTNALIRKTYCDPMRLSTNQININPVEHALQIAQIKYIMFGCLNSLLIITSQMLMV